MRLLARVRIQARTLLTVLSWPGDHGAAVNALHCLVDNAARYGSLVHSGKDLRACLRVTEAHDLLLIDVTDPNPAFPDFDQALAAGPERSLGGVVSRGGTITWSITPQADAKTVRAALRPTPVDP
ncbi:ATP-binding protein [Streptomyces sp. NPDC055099]